MKITKLSALILPMIFLANCKTSLDNYERYYASWARKEGEKVKADVAKRSLERQQMAQELKMHAERTNKMFATPEPDSPCLLTVSKERVKQITKPEQWTRLGFDRQKLSSWVKKRHPYLFAKHPVCSWNLLESESCKRLFPKYNFLRLKTWSDPNMHWIMRNTLVLSNGKPLLLCVDGNEDSVNKLFADSTFKPKCVDDARHVLFAFAEVSGLILLREMPTFRQEHRSDNKLLEKANRVDWRMYWRPLPDNSGWQVSCVFCSILLNWSCSRYEIEILKNGGFEVKKCEPVFFSYYIL